MPEVDLLVDGLDFGEGPRWRDGQLWYSDFFQHRVYTVTPDGRRETVLDLGRNNPPGWGGFLMATSWSWECLVGAFSATTAQR